MLLSICIWFHLIWCFRFQVSQVPNKEVFEEAQCKRLAKGYCFKQRQKCVWIAVLQHCRGWGWGRRLKLMLFYTFGRSCLSVLRHYFNLYHLRSYFIVLCIKWILFTRWVTVLVESSMESTDICTLSFCVLLICLAGCSVFPFHVLSLVLILFCWRIHMEFSCNSLLSGFILCLATKMCMELFGTILVFLITCGLFFSLIKRVIRDGNSWLIVASFFHLQKKQLLFLRIS